MKNYSPLSNLSYVFKLTEKIVLQQIDIHLEKHSLQEPNQSAYRAKYSTENTLVKIVSDLQCTIMCYSSHAGYVSRF